jgi:hypothetical protein
MGSFSILHWIVVVLVFIPNLFFIPAVRKSGFSPWWIAPTLIPGLGMLVGMVLLWIWAFSSWPSQGGQIEQ